MEYLEQEPRKGRDWLCALRRQAMRGLSFEAELSLAEQASTAGEWEQAEIHLTSSIERLVAEGFDYTCWKRCVEAHVRRYLKQNLPDLAIQVLCFAAVDMSMREGAEHSLARHFENELSRLRWAEACAEVDSLENFMKESFRPGPDLLQGQQEIIEAMARHHCSWDRCLDYSRMCMAHGQLRGAEVACWAAMMLCDGPDDCRFVETVESLCAVYMQASAPSYAEMSLRWAIMECQEHLERNHLTTHFLVKKLETLFLNQGRKREAEALWGQVFG